MKRFKVLGLLIIVTVFGLLIVTSCENGTGPNGGDEESEDKGKIIGRVTESSGVPLEDVSISTGPETKLVMTDAEGKYEIDDVRVGVYKIFVRKEGYEDKQTEITVNKGEIAIADLTINI